MLFSIVATGKDVQEVLFGKNGVCSQGGKIPPTVVDCSTIAVEESAASAISLSSSARIRRRAGERQRESDQGRQASAVVSGNEAACKAVMPLIETFAQRGVSYVGEGELARVCKIAHNVMLGVVIENLIEITLLTNKMGVPRHAFLAFLNNSAMGSMFTRYKSPALVNLDWTTTFTPELLRKDLDLGLELGREIDVPMPVTAAAREVLQTHFGAAMLQKESGRIFAEGLFGIGRNHGAGRRHEARKREPEHPDGPGKLARRLISRTCITGAPNGAPRSIQNGAAPASVRKMRGTRSAC